MLILILILIKVAHGELTPGAIDGYLTGLLFAELVVEFFLIGLFTTREDKK